MNYINSNLAKDEHIIYQTKPHRIIYATPIFWLVLSLYLVFIGPNIPIFNLPLHKVAATITFILAIYSGISAYVIYTTSEYGITNKRLIMKTGFIQRRILEIPLSRVESIMVYQSILGRLFQYGSIVVSGIGGSKDIFYNIPDPLQFRKKVQDSTL